MKWISVKDRLPEAKEHAKPFLCLVSWGTGKPFAYVLNWYAYGDNGYVKGEHFADEGLNGMKVTHWLPLPPAPKEAE